MADSDRNDATSPQPTSPSKVTQGPGRDADAHPPLPAHRGAEMGRAEDLAPQKPGATGEPLAPQNRSKL
jgi:hypothetical protein